MICVMDAGPMIALLRAEPGADVVVDLLAGPDNSCYAHALNLCEVYYGFIRTSGEAMARRALRDLRAAGIQTRRDLSASFCRSVARLKAPGHIALPDCVCITLAQWLGGEVITTDHREFDPLVPRGIVPIRFIR